MKNTPKYGKRGTRSEIIPLFPENAVRVLTSKVPPFPRFLEQAWSQKNSRVTPPGWLSRYRLLENFNASVTSTSTRTGTRMGTRTTGVTAIALCTSCSRAKKKRKKSTSFFILFFLNKNPCLFHRHAFAGMFPVYFMAVLL